MSTLIIFESKYGTVEKCVNTLKDKLKDNTTVSTAKETLKNKDMDTYDTIIIGCSIHAGSIPGKIKKIMKKFKSLLLQKKTGFFLCTMTPPEKAGHYFEKNFPLDLMEKATAKGLFGGELIFEKMNSIERHILKQIAKTDKNFSHVSESNITQFAKKMS